MFCIQFLSKLETQSIAFFSQRPQRVHSWLKDNFSELDTCVSVQNWKTIIKDKTKQNRHTLQVSGASQGNSFVLWLRCDCFSRVGTMHGSPRLPTSGLLFLKIKTYKVCAWFHENPADNEFLKIKLGAGRMAQKEQSACWQVCWYEFDLWNPMMEKEQTPIGCALTSTCASQNAILAVHTINFNKE